ncbi:MAG: HAD family hydrolase [Candidatus Woesearchaeota archaeon]
MKKKCKSGLEAVVSDLDGTLVKVSDEYCKELFEEVFKALNLIGKSEHLNKRTATDLFYNAKREEMIKDLYAKKSMDFDREYFWQEYHRIEKRKDLLEKRIKSLKVYDDVRILKELSEKGTKIGIITQSQEEIAFAEIKKIEHEINLKIRKDFVIHNSSYDFVKPDYRVLEKMIESMKIKESIVYLGDSETDLLLIKNFYEHSEIKNIKIFPLIVLREYFNRNRKFLLENFLSYGLDFRRINSLNSVKKETIK